MRGRHAWMLGAVALPACSLLTDLGGLSSGAAPGTDSGGDGSGSDSGSADGEASADGRTDSPSSAFPCGATTATPAFCASFEGGKLLASGASTSSEFDSEEHNVPAAPAIDETQSVSPTRSALFVMPGSIPDSRSQLARKFSGPTPAKITFALSTRLDPITSYEVDLQEIRFGDDGGGLYLRVEDGEARVREYYRENGMGKSVDVLTISGIPLRQWFHMSWTIEPAAQKIAVAIDGKPVPGGTAMLVAPHAGPFTTFIAGTTYTVTSQPMKMWVDDVLVDF